MGGVEVVGRDNDDEPRASGLMVDISAALLERDLGEGMPEPVDAYTGRNSSGL